jgi:hypothetical protein
MSIAQLKGNGGKLYLVKWDQSTGWGENRIRITLKQVRSNLVKWTHIQFITWQPDKETIAFK